MPRTVTYRIIDQPDGRFTVAAVMEPGRHYRREDLATLGEAEAWIEGLRVLMAACAAPLVRAEPLPELERLPEPLSGPAPVQASAVTRSGPQQERSSESGEGDAQSSDRPPQQSIIR